MQQQSIDSHIHNGIAVSAQQSTFLQILGAAVLGIVMLFGVGFAAIGIAHNAAHDTRHSFVFPCH